MVGFWANFKQKLGVVAAVLIGVLGIFFVIEKDQKEGLEEQLLNKDSKDKDAALAQQQAVLEADSKKTQAEADQEKAAPLSDQDALDTLDKL